MACAYENVKYLIKEDIIGHVQRLAPVFEDCMKTVMENHPCIKQYRRYVETATRTNRIESRARTIDLPSHHRILFHLSFT